MRYKGKKTDATWPEVWNQIQALMERQGASEEVRRLAQAKFVGWNCANAKFYIFCPKAVYDWLELPAVPDTDSRLSLVKPIIWPFMQKYNCKDLIYRIIEL